MLMSIIFSLANKTEILDSETHVKILFSSMWHKQIEVSVTIYI